MLRTGESGAAGTCSAEVPGSPNVQLRLGGHSPPPPPHPGACLGLQPNAAWDGPCCGAGREGRLAGFVSLQGGRARCRLRERLGAEKHLTPAVHLGMFLRA